MTSISARPIYFDGICRYDVRHRRIIYLCGNMAASGFEPVNKIDRLCYSRSKMKYGIGGIDYDIYHSAIYRCLHCCVDA